MAKRRAKTTATSDVAYTFRLPAAQLEGVQGMAQRRGETVTRYIRRALRTQFVVDSVGPEADTAIRLVEQGTAKATQAATLAADAAQAACLLLHDLLTAQLEVAGLPRKLAVQQADARVAAAWDGVSTLPSPEGARLPAWLTGDPDSEEE